MSMPYSLLDCPDCGYRASMACLAGHFVYEDDAGAEAFITRRLGWCHDCRNAVPLEVLPDAEIIGAERAAAQEQVDAHASAEAARPATLFRWLRDLLPKRAESQEMKKARAALRSTELLAAVLETARGPRCLACGSQTAEPIALPDPETWGERFNLDLDFRHPGCEQPMRFRDSGGTRLALVPTKRVYDPQGRFIRHAERRPPR
jgi:hypothetical protein